MALSSMTNYIAMQNPVVSCAWLVANLQLLAPFISLTVDTKKFCEPVFRSRVLLVFAIIYTSLSYVAVLVRPSDTINFLKIYNFTESFRVYFALVAGAGFLAYVLVVHCARRILHSLSAENCRVQPL